MFNFAENCTLRVLSLVSEQVMFHNIRNNQSSNSSASRKRKRLEESSSESE